MEEVITAFERGRKDEIYDMFEGGYEVKAEVDEK